MIDANETRSLEALEVKVAFMEDALGKLSDEFYFQQKELEVLKTQYAALVNKLRTAPDNETSANEIRDERPPHY